MKIQKFGGNNNAIYIIRIEPGEPLMVKLAEFAHNEKIGFAWVSAIGGGFKKVKYAFSVGFDTGYEPIKTSPAEVEGQLELLNASGCIAWNHNDQSKPAVHLHATFIDKELKGAFGGHLIEAEEAIGLTAEVRVEVLSWEKITRKLDERVNVPLLNLPDYLPSSLGQTGSTGQEENSQEKIKKLEKENSILREQNIKLVEQNTELTNKLIAQVSINPKT